MHPLITWFDSAESLVESAQPSLARIRKTEDHIVSAPVQDGFCLLCDRMTRMTVFGGAMLGEHINLREGMVCQACGINARSRLLYWAASSVFPAPESRLAIFEAFSPLARAMAKRWPNASLSEFFDSEAAPGAPMSRELPGGLTGSASHEDLMRLSYPSKSLDGLVHNDVLEHVADVDIALGEMFRVLRPGGSAVFTMPWFPWAERTKVRGKLGSDGKLVELLPKEYHGDGLRSEGIYTFYNFGGDFRGMLANAGFSQPRFGACYAPTFGFLSNNHRYDADGLMMPTVLMATKPT